MEATGSTGDLQLLRDATARVAVIRWGVAMGPMLPEGFYVAGWRIGPRRTDIDDECLIAVPTSHHGAKSVQRRRSSFKLSGTLSVLSLLLTEKDGGVVLLTYLRTTGK